MLIKWEHYLLSWEINIILLINYSYWGDINEINLIKKHFNERFNILEQERKDLSVEDERLRKDNLNLTNEINQIQNEANSNKTNSDNKLFNLKERLHSTKK